MIRLQQLQAQGNEDRRLQKLHQLVRLHEKAHRDVHLREALDELKGEVVGLREETQRQRGHRIVGPASEELVEDVPHFGRSVGLETSLQDVPQVLQLMRRQENQVQSMDEQRNKLQVPMLLKHRCQQQIDALRVQHDAESSNDHRSSAFQQARLLAEKIHDRRENPMKLRLGGGDLRQDLQIEEHDVVRGVFQGSQEDRQQGIQVHVDVGGSAQEHADPLEGHDARRNVAGYQVLLEDLQDASHLVQARALDQLEQLLIRHRRQLSNVRLRVGHAI
mmetsp:Transcript_11168/g.41695  ORF Transcript_11168/g.41695 Transcript_11168/m.41695 type:complete len:276 (-) Transcript_11168:1127-1954(-)